MTIENVDGRALLSKLMVEGSGDFLLKLLVDALQHVMEAEVSAVCGAEYGERSAERLVSRNGYRPRTLETRMGTADLAVPKLRRGSYFPSFLEPRRRWEKAFVNVVSEAYILGVSTRRVEELVEAMGAKGVSRSEVSRMAASLDEQVAAFRTRPLSDMTWPYIWLDALYLKVREGGRVVSKAFLVAYGVNNIGERQVVGCSLAAGEMETAWRGFLEGLVARGLSGVQLVISDAHTGLRAGIRGVFNGTTWQRCSVHFLRNVLSRLPRNAQSFASAAVRAMFRQPDRQMAKEAAGKAIALLEPKHPDAAQVIRNAEDDVLAFMSFPEKHWRQLKSTNPLERLNREIRRRTDVVGIFPNDASVLRLVTMLLVEQNDEWAVGRRYFSEASMTAMLTGSVPPTALELR
jgi:transposase-like protein